MQKTRNIAKAAARLGIATAVCAVVGLGVLCWNTGADPSELADRLTEPATQEFTEEVVDYDMAPTVSSKAVAQGESSEADAQDAELNTTAFGDEYFRRGPIEYYSLYKGDEARRVIYSEIVGAAQEGEHFSTTPSGEWLGGQALLNNYAVPATDVNTIFQEACYDYPMASAYRTGNDQLFSYMSNYGYYALITDMTTDPNADATALYPAVDQAARQIEKASLSYADGSARKYITAAYKYIADGISYSDGVNDTVHHNDIYGALIEGESKCYGVSSALKYVLDGQGVPSFIASGVVNGNEQHAWNIVLLNDQWYVCDLTIGITGSDGTPGSVEPNGTTIEDSYEGCLVPQNTYFNTYNVRMDQRCYDLEHYYEDAMGF